MIQIIVRSQRPTTTVHLAGSFVISHVAVALLRTYQQRHHHNYVLKLVPLAPHIFLLTGLDTIRPACCFHGEVDIVTISITSHSLRSSDNVTIRQVAYMTSLRIITPTYNFVANCTSELGLLRVECSGPAKSSCFAARTMLSAVNYYYPDRGAQSIVLSVCVCLCLCVCLSAIISPELHV